MTLHMSVNLMVGWKLLANRTKSLISFSFMVQTEKMTSMNLFQRIGLRGLDASSCYSICAIKMTAKATAMLVPLLCPGSAKNVCH